MLSMFLMHFVKCDANHSVQNTTFFKMFFLLNSSSCGTADIIKAIGHAEPLLFFIATDAAANFAINLQIKKPT